MFGRAKFSLSLAQKLYMLIAFNLAVIILLTGLGYFSLKIFASTRAYTNGEGLWSKAQKEAVFDLLLYARSGDSSEYRAFFEQLSVPLGDKRARLELDKPDPYSAVVREGFEQGLNHPDDVDNMAWLYRNFRHFRYLERSIGIWREADGHIEELIGLARQLQEVRSQPAPDPTRMNTLITQIHDVDARLTELEDAFSASLGEGTRLINGFATFTFIAAGGIFIAISAFSSFLLARRIRLGIRALRSGAKRVAQGDYSSKVELLCRDELGELAADFNWMTEQLAAGRDEVKNKETSLHQSQEKLRVYSQELERSNRELEQFAYVASHDLQEPLRGVASFSDLLARRYRGQLDQDADDFIGYIVSGAQRMQTLINDLLAFSRVTTKGERFKPVDSGAILKEVLHVLEEPIEQSGAQISLTPLPVISADEVQFGQLLQNLISNALKFHGEKPPRIQITAQEQPGAWLFSVKDEGIGIAPAYHERIFELFQRLHGKGEYEGTGLGLAICKKIVERHGGRIWVESEEGKGATFFFTIAREAA